MEALHVKRGNLFKLRAFTLSISTVNPCEVKTGVYCFGQPIQQTIPIARRRFRENRPLTLRFVNTCAVLDTINKWYDQAEELFGQALKGRQHELGDDHPETLETINDLGILHREQRHYEKANRLLTEALEKRKAKLGDNHPHTLQSMHELGVLYKEQGDCAKAEKPILKALEGRRLKLGGTHPHTLASLNNLIALYEAWNKPEKAEEWRAKLEQIEDFEESQNTLKVTSSRH